MLKYFDKMLNKKEMILTVLGSTIQGFLWRDPSCCIIRQEVRQEVRRLCTAEGEGLDTSFYQEIIPVGTNQLPWLQCESIHKCRNMESGRISTVQWKIEFMVQEPRAQRRPLSRHASSHPPDIGRSQLQWYYKHWYDALHVGSWWLPFYILIY